MFESLVAEYLAAPIPDLVERDVAPLDLPEPSRNNLVYTITGVRRCGKTFFMFQTMRRLLAEGIDRKLVFHFSFDDERIRPYEDGTANEVLEAYYRLVPEARKGCYLFFDEIQDAPNWSIFVRRVSETQPVTIVLTGSSSKLLSSDVPTVFRGRSLVREMWPLSFREFCTFRSIEPPALAGAYTPEETARLERAFDDYLICGGFPAVQRLTALERVQLLQGYAGQIVTRDVVERFGSVSFRVAERFSRSALRSTALKFSVNKQVKTLRSAGIPVSPNRLYDLLDDLEDAHLLFKMGDYTLSLRENPRSSYKVYSVDPGLALAVAPANHLDEGQRLETAVFIELKRRHGANRQNVIASYSASDCPEVDFVVGDIALEEEYELIQVAVASGAESPDGELSKKYRSEVGNLAAAMRRTGLGEGTLVTKREEAEVPVDGGTVHLVPAWKWFFGG